MLCSKTSTAMQGCFCKKAGWRVRNLITMFCQIVKRPHRPKEKNLIKMYKMLNIAIPEGVYIVSNWRVLCKQALHVQ